MHCRQVYPLETKLIQCLSTSWGTIPTFQNLQPTEGERTREDMPRITAHGCKSASCTSCAWSPVLLLLASPAAARQPSSSHDCLDGAVPSAPNATVFSLTWHFSAHIYLAFCCGLFNILLCIQLLILFFFGVPSLFSRRTDWQKLKDNGLFIVLVLIRKHIYILWRHRNRIIRIVSAIRDSL